jgi:dipeptidyl aminopeptidase/acylaminoacyl peptidase
VRAQCSAAKRQLISAGLKELCRSQPYDVKFRSVMTLSRSCSCAVALFLACVPFGATAVARTIGLADLRALLSIESPQFSPDGKQIAFVTKRPDFREDRYDATLWVIDVDGGHLRVLVRGMRSLAMPRWSPDGRTIAFTAKPAGREGQIYSAPIGGGTPVKLSHARRGVEQFAYGPDGRTIAYVTPDELQRGVGGPQSHHDLFTIQDDDYLVREAPVPSHIWLVTLSDGRARQLTKGLTSVLENDPPFEGDVSAPSWSADGRWIVYSRQANADDADTDRTSVAVVNVESGVERLITGDQSYEYDASFAPQGEKVAYLHPHGPGPLSNMDLFVGSIEGRAGCDSSAALDRSLLADFAWLPTGNGLVAIANDGVRKALFLQPLNGKGRRLDIGALNALAVTASRDGALAIVADDQTDAPELYVMATAEGHPLRLTHINAALTRFEYPRSVEARWRAPDGELNDGILTYPNGYKQGVRYPLVVYSHGGPEDSATEDFEAGGSGPMRDLFAAQGMLVFEPNYRGSDNLGNVHEHAIFRDPGDGPDSDVISGIHMLEGLGIVDTSRIAAVGHSYGGYMTAWLISHHHFWRCAVVADGAVDWTQSYELAGAGNMAWTRDSLGGDPWDPKSASLYRTGSPITYAREITTPTLIISGTDDTVVPITQSFALYHALASRHTAVRFIGIPGAHHSPQDPVHRELYYRAIDEWVQGHFGRRSAVSQ